MRSLFINRQSSARPITSPKMGLSRWSRRRRTTLTGLDIISEPGALILTAPCEPVVSFVRKSVGAKGVDFPTVKSSRESQRETTSVRILAAASATPPVRLAPARAESRDATERSRAGRRGVAATWRPAQADGWRSEGARPCLRAPCRIIPLLHEDAPIQRSAARLRDGRPCPAGGCPAGFGQRVLPDGCHSPASDGRITYASPNLTLLG
jgi:hypothetical protein